MLVIPAAHGGASCLLAIPSLPAGAVPPSPLPLPPTSCMVPLSLTLPQRPPHLAAAGTSASPVSSGAGGWMKVLSIQLKGCVAGEKSSACLGIISLC